MVITGIKATLYNYKLHYITKTIFCKHLFKKTREKIIKLRILWQISSRTDGATGPRPFHSSCIS